MRTVITYGTFDLFHVGHIRLLRRARALGDRLFVGISTDEFNAQKNKRSINNFMARCEIVSACRFVDGVFAEEHWDQKLSDITRLSADIFAMGDDWTGRFDDLSRYCSVVYLPRTQGVSTTQIRNIISQNSLMAAESCRPLDMYCD